MLIRNTKNTVNWIANGYSLSKDILDFLLSIAGTDVSFALTSKISS